MSRGNSVGQALFTSEDPEWTQSQVNQTGFWDSRAKAKAKSNPKPISKPAGLWGRLKKQPAQDPFIESAPAEAEAETDEEESDVEVEAVAPSPPTPKTKGRVVPQTRKRLLKYRASVDEPESTTTAEKDSTSTKRDSDDTPRKVVPHHSRRRESTAQSEAELRALFEERTEEVVQTKTSDVPDTSVSQQDFEETPPSSQKPSPSEKSIQQVAQDTEPESDLTEKSEAPKPDPSDDDALINLPVTEAKPRASDSEHATSTAAAPDASPEKIDVDSPEEPEPPAGKARVDDSSVKSDSAPPPEVAPAEPASATPPKPAKVKLYPSRTPQTAGASKGRRRSAEDDLPIITPAPKLEQPTQRSIQRRVQSKPARMAVAEPTEADAEDVATSEPTQPRIRGKKAPTTLPLQVLANRPAQVEIPEGWSAAKKLPIRRYVPPTTIQPETTPSPAEAAEDTVSEEGEEPQFPTTPDSDVAEPISEASIAPRRDRRKSPIQIVHANADSLLGVESATYHDEESTDEAPVMQTTDEEPVVIPELVQESQFPWTTWLLIAFGAGFAICRLLFRPANAD